MISPNCPFGSLTELVPWMFVLCPLVGIGLACIRVAPWEPILLGNAVTLDWVAHLALHSTFYCVAFAALIGVHNCEPQWAIYGVIAFFILLCLVASWACMWQRHKLSTQCSRDPVV